MDNQYFSREGLEKIKKELEERTKIMRPEIAQRIKEAKELGDLSENAEYDSAKEAQALNEGRIEDIKNILSQGACFRRQGFSYWTMNREHLYAQVSFP